MSETIRKITAFEARTHLGELLDYVRYSKKPCLVERHGKPIAALIDIETFERQAVQSQYEEWISQAVEQIKTHYQPIKIILFGSAAAGQIKDGSDIDLLIIKETDKRKLDRMDEVIDLLDLEIPIEAHVFTPKEIEERIKLHDFFIKEILNSGQVLYEKKE
ncbi:MAG: type II toxin-antitoxin system prevent-host-death family antitoxin [Pseudomonadota bacterium]